MNQTEDQIETNGCIVRKNSDEKLNEHSTTNNSSDDSVDSSELPDLINIEEKDQVVEETRDPNNVEMTDEKQTGFDWEDILGTGRLYVKRLDIGDGRIIQRHDSVEIEILQPAAELSAQFGTKHCEVKRHSLLKVLIGDQLDPAPGAIELAIHGLAVGGEVAVRSHIELRQNLPEEFQIKILNIGKDLLEQADENKFRGNNSYKNKDFEKAVRYYERGLSFIDEYHADSETSETSKDIWTKLTKNLGRCFFRLGKNDSSVQKFNDVLASSPKDIDVLLLKLDVLTNDKKFDDVIIICNELLTHDLDEKTKKNVNTRMNKVLQARKKQEEKYVIMCQKMAGTYSKPEKAECREKISAPAPINETENDSRLKQILIGGAILAVIVSTIAYHDYKK